MSASNWTKCPICKTKAEKIKKKLKDSYGVVSADEYENLRKEVYEGTEEADDETTLREDYEQGVNDDGSVYFYYSCFCETCGFDKNIKYEENEHRIVEKKNEF